VVGEHAGCRPNRHCRRRRRRRCRRHICILPLLFDAASDCSDPTPHALSEPRRICLSQLLLWMLFRSAVRCPRVRLRLCLPDPNAMPTRASRRGHHRRRRRHHPPPPPPPSAGLTPQPLGGSGNTALIKSLFDGMHGEETDVVLRDGGGGEGSGGAVLGPNSGTTNTAGSDDKSFGGADETPGDTTPKPKRRITLGRPVKSRAAPPRPPPIKLASDAAPPPTAAATQEEAQSPPVVRRPPKIFLKRPPA
jgi:hypothetical protein